MRLFIAILLPDDVKDKLEDTQRRLREHAARGNFSRRDNLHLTLLFLGDVPGSQVGVLEHALDSLTNAPFTLAVSGIGRFTKTGGDIWWAGVDGGRALTALRRAIVDAVADSGVRFERGRFSPHITLARQVRLRDDMLPIALSDETTSATIEADSVSLMLSDRIDGVLTYSELYRKVLTE